MKTQTNIVKNFGYLKAVARDICAKHKLNYDKIGLFFKYKSLGYNNSETSKLINVDRSLLYDWIRKLKTMDESEFNLIFSVIVMDKFLDTKK